MIWMVRIAWLISAVLVRVGSSPQDSDPAACERLFLTGSYDECARVSHEAIARGARHENWWIWNARAHLARGRYEEASTRVQEGLSKFSFSVRLRLLAHEVFLRNGDAKRAQAALREIEQLAGRIPGRYGDGADRVALGRAALLLRADPRRVLELIYDPVRKEKQPLRDVFLASGELALDKHDDAVAAELFQEGLNRFPDDPDIYFGLARAFAHSDPKRTLESVQAALRINASHVPSLLFLADHAIDSEQYAEAEQWLGRALEVDPWRAEAWAYRAVLAHLEGTGQREFDFRSTALKFAPNNPVVDHLIGRKLSQKYRFQEGAAYQRKSLACDTDYLPARIQLAQDLLRLGDDSGWHFAEAVHKQDRYDIVAYNLVTLRDNISRFSELRDKQLVVRMDQREADLYGDRVLQLLTRARESLCRKYGLELREPVTVELFPKQSDFAVRTFGMPGGAGYLGVCFGKLVTANSPASRGDHPVSWESVLWHEFCHVVTLQLTRNKMPRWLSEGISVYEERQADPAWGQHMNPQYREMILNGQLTPVGKLSAAFLAPPTPRHLQFAYFESSLVVEFLVDRFGHETMIEMLSDLAGDLSMNAALEKHTGLELSELERRFEAFARECAEQLAPGTDLDRDRLPQGGRVSAPELAEWLDGHENSFWGHLRLGSLLVSERKFAEAKAPLRRAIELYSGYFEPDNPYAMLAAVHRELKEAEDERAVLRQWVERDADAVPAMLRLLELDTAAADWPALAADAERVLAANPLLPQPHRALARAAEQMDRPADAIAQYKRLVLMDPEDPAELHFRLAQLLHAAGDAAAKRHVLMALEEAPRFPEALRLLLKMEPASEP